MNAVLPSVAAAIAWCVLFMGTILVLAYQRARLGIATLVPLLLLISSSAGATQAAVYASGAHARIRNYDSKVLALVNVDDFAAHELVMGA